MIKMSNVLALDIETKNYSHEIGGWRNTHMFIPSVICTWNGDVGTIYIDKSVDDLAKSNVIIKSIRELKFDLDKHIQKGGVVLGHNIAHFDLPVLRDSLDIYCINKYFNKKAYIDTSRLVSSETGERYSLGNLVKHTLGDSKIMESADAPMIWKQGGYSEVAEYCLKDCELVWDLWKYGQENGFVKGFSIDGEETKKIEVNW